MYFRSTAKMDLTQLIGQLVQTIMLLSIGISHNSFCLSLPTRGNHRSNSKSALTLTYSDIQKIVANTNNVKRQNSIQEVGLSEAIANSVLDTPDSEKESKRYRRLCKYTTYYSYLYYICNYYCRNCL